MRPEFGLQGRPVRAPQHLGREMGARTGSKRVADRALLAGDGCTVHPCRMDQVVDPLAQQVFLLLVAQQLQTGAVAEGADAVRVDPENPFFSAVKQVVYPFVLGPQLFLYPRPLRKLPPQGLGLFGKALEGVIHDAPDDVEFGDPGRLNLSG